MSSSLAESLPLAAAAPVIPQPRAWPVVGHVPHIDPAVPVQSLMKLVAIHGPIFRLILPKQTMLILSGQELVADACDESRFEKHVHGPLAHIRDFAGDGLFTAHNEEPNWGKAHRVLMPAFGPAAMKNYFEDMLEIADQMLTKWQRLGSDAEIDVPDAMTRLTLDTIALCGFGYRFNSFYQREMHPFVEAMVRGLAEAGRRTKRLPLETQLRFLSRQQYVADARFMHEVTETVIAKRRAEGPGNSPRDLLGLMLEGKDPVTGEGLDDANIRNQLVTFLIAGHETTSGLLAFTTHLLLDHPETFRRARAEVDEVLGGEAPRFEDLAKLTYLDQILRETLRLYPTAPAFAVHAKAPTTLAGRYPMGKGDVALVLLPALHRDPAVWNEPSRFDPDRFAPNARANIPRSAWLPFGNGMRACLGRSFALQEATIVLALMLQRFDLTRPGPYTLSVKETLTLKPDGLFLRARSRREPVARPGSAASRPSASPRTKSDDNPAKAGHGTPLHVYYGSNAGASEAFARRIATDGAARGYAAKVLPLDEAAGALPTAGAAVVVTASYNGEPPDNARTFCRWLGGVAPGALAGVRYAVFGCGNRDWGATYQRVPSLIDEGLRQAGASPLVPRGEADARGDFFGDFESWYGPFWDQLGAAFGVATAGSTSPLYRLEVVPAGGVELVRQNRLAFATVTANRELVDMTAAFARSKRHLELELPAGTTYQAGDYLAVLPENHSNLVARGAARFGLAATTTIVLHADRAGPTSALPTGRPISVGELLARHVELSAPATRRDVELLAAKNVCPPHRAHLAAIAGDPDRYRTDVYNKRTSVLDLIEMFPSCQLSFAEFLELLPAMRVRQYSVSSSPKATPARCSLTVAVVEGAAWSGVGTFHGTASSYLARLAPGTEVAVAVRSPQNSFRPPADNSTPMILIAAGTGLAPFRGFLQERRARAQAGEPAGTSLLFFGCDHPEVDFLYRDEIAGWQEEGIVTALPAFFRQPDGDVTFVQHRLWRERARVLALLEDGAHVFICGDGQRMAPAVRSTLARIYQDARGVTEAESLAWLGGLERTGRYAADVFA